MLEAAEADANLKRRLRFEVAAQGGAERLAAELDRRLQTLASSRARVSWRKRPELIADLLTLKRMIVERLAPRDADAALPRLIAWFDLQPKLAVRVRDAKGDLVAVFEGAAPDLWTVAGAADPRVAARLLAEAVARAPAAYARWVGAGADALPPGLAQALLDDLLGEGAPPSSSARAVVRRLADRAGDLDQWLSLVTPAERTSPDFAAETALRLVAADRLPEARAALEAATRTAGRRWPLGGAVLTPAWERASIAVLEAEGFAGEAQTLRWRLFERDLDPGVLRQHLARLPDFEDVEAMDRALAHAAAFADFATGLQFLMNWPAHRQAAQMVLARRRDAQRPHPEAADWASRLAQRFPQAAEILLAGI